MLSRLKFEINDLVTEMLDQIPDKYFKSSTATFLDPSMAGGQFVKEIIKRLTFAGHSMDNIKSRIYGLCDTPVTFNVIDMKREIIGKFEVGKTEKLEEWKEMGKKFDVIVGNPPYNTPKKKDSTRTGQLYVRFVDICLDLAPVVCLVTPSLWTDKKSKMKHRLTPHLKKIWETTDRFPVDIPTCAFVYDSSYNDKCTIVTSSLNAIVKDISDGIIPMHGDNKTMSFISKIKTTDNLSNLWRRGSINRNDSRIGAGEKQIVLSAGKAGQEYISSQITCDDDEFVWYDHWKVIVNNVGEWKSLGSNAKIVPPQVGTSYSIIALGVSSEAEATVLLNYINSKFVKSIIHMVKNNTPNSKTVFSSVPAVDLSRTWTDEELYNHFNLTDSEIQLIEETVK